MKTSLTLFIVLFSSLLVSLHQCGHIYSQPTEIIPQNVNKASTFHFFFMLETSLLAGDCLYIKFPFNVGSDISATISTSIDLTASTSIQTTAAAEPSTSEYRLFQLPSTASLAANTWYRVVVSMGTTGLNAQLPNVMGCVRFATTSSTASGYIIYDENRCFDVLSFAPAVDTSGSFAVNGYYQYNAGSTNYFKALSGSYVALFDITPSQVVTGGSTITLTLPSPFNFTGTCSSVGCSATNAGDSGDYCPSVFSALGATAYNCSVKGSKLTLMLLQTNSYNITSKSCTSFRIQATIQNPAQYISSGQSVTASFESSKAPIIFATANVVAGSVNALTLITDYVPATANSGAVVNTLLWGVAPSNSTVYARRSAGYTGCPIVLFASSPNVKVYNTLQTKFTVSTTIPAMDYHQGVQALWTLVTASGISGTVADSVIYNSLFTTLPGSVSFAYASNVVTVSSVTQVSPGTYSFGAKFSLDVSANLGMISTTSATPPKPVCGAVTLQTGDGNLKFGQWTGVDIGIKLNMEYQDVALLAGASAALGSLKLYNSAFSYWVETTHYDFGTPGTNVSTAYNTFNNYFLGASTTGATAAVWPKPTSITPQGLLLPLTFSSTAVCPSANAHNSTDYFNVGVAFQLNVNCNDTDNGTPTQIGSLLKVIFNNNILNLGSASFYYGTKVIGSLFPSATAGYSNYNTGVNTSVSPIGNIIAKEGDFWHLSISCKGTSATTDLTCYQAPGFGKTGSDPTATYTFSALAFIDTNVKVYPSMYADANVFDFIVCLKIAGYSTISVIYTNSTATSAPLENAAPSSGAPLAQWQLVEDGCSNTTVCALSTSPNQPTGAGPGIINGYVISGAVDPTSLKISVVNGYLGVTPAKNGLTESTGAVAPFIPAYLRLGMTINSPVSTISTIAFFIGGAGAGTNTFYEGLATYKDISGSINIIDTQGSVTTAIVGKGAMVYDASTVDLWWAQNCLILNGVSGNTFNFYVPIQTSFISIDSLNVVLLGSKSSNGIYPVNGVYRVFGAIVSNSIINSTNFALTGGMFNHVVKTMLDANIVYSTKFTISAGLLSVSAPPACYWDNGWIASPVTTGGCLGGSTSATGFIAPKIMPGSGSNFQPSVTIKTSYISTDVTNSTGDLCHISAGNTGASSATGAKVSLSSWGSAFIVYIRENSNIFSGSTLTWSYAGASTTNKCWPHKIMYSTSAIITIFCTTDQVGGQTYGSGGGSLTFNGVGYIVPFYWGSGYKLYNKLNYAWSTKEGAWGSFNGDPAVTTSWTYSSGCTVTDQNSLAASSIDTPLTLTLTSTLNKGNYYLNTNDYLNLAISTLVAGNSTYTFYQSCTHTSLKCDVTTAGSSSSSTTITLTNIASSTVSVSSSITLITWVDTTSAFGTANTIKVDISFNNAGNIIETCTTDATSGKGFGVGATGSQSTVMIDSAQFMLNQGARGSWSFTFSYKALIRKTYDFSLNVGALAGNTSTSNNYRCLILSNGVVSNSWSTLTPISSAISTVTAKVDIPASSSNSFTYKCLGGYAPTNTNVALATKLTGTLERSGSVQTATATTTGYTIPTPLDSAPYLASVSLLSKFFNVRGFDADYLISFIPSVANITASGRILVEFSQGIAPKLNRYGFPECYLNETPAFCEFPNSDERRILVWPTMSLLNTTSVLTPYILRIARVTQPTSTDADSNKQIFFALSNVSDPYQGITEFAYLPETWDTNTNTIASILIQDFSYQNSKIRSSTSFTYVLNFPANLITTASFLWVQLPGSIARSLIYGSIPSVSLSRVGDSTNTALVNTTSVLRGGRIAVTLKADAANSNPTNYTLTISGLATPQNPLQMGFVRDDFRIFLSDSTFTNVVASTAAGARNSTTYVSWNTGSYSASQLLFWYDPNKKQVNGADVFIGTYRTLVYLSASLNTFTNTFNFSANGGNSSSFLAAPMDPAYPIRAVLGTPAAPVFIAAKSGTNPGAYYISWSSTDTTGYSPLPNLDLRVLSQNCKPDLLANSFDVPYGGTSDPIVLDFSKCIPVADVNILANITNGYTNLSDPQGISLSGSQTQNATLTWTNMNGNYRVSFYAVSQQGSNGTNLQNVVTISFKFSGTNGDNIDNPGTVTINLVQPTTVAPVVLTPSVSASTLSVGCDQSGTSFFALATFTNAAVYNATYINQKTQSVNVPLTSPAQNDPTYTVFGYQAGLIASTYSQVILSGKLKAGSNYTVYAFCVNNVYLASNASALFAWKQDPNGGYTISLKAVFKNPISSSQKVELACALAKDLQIASKRVLTDEGKWCTTLRMMQTTTNATNSTTSNTTSNSTSSNSTNSSSNATANVSQTYSTYFYLLQDYFAATDNAAATIQSRISSATYLTNLIKATGDSSFPNISSTLMTATNVTVATDANGQTIIPVVNYISSVTDTVSINATFNLTNMNGVIYAGVEPVVANVSAIPNATNLVQGLNGNGLALTAFNYSITTQNVPVTISLTNLNNNTQYLLYYVGNNLDISFNGVFSSVVNITVSTNAPSSSFGSVISMSMMVLAVVLLGLLGMI